MPKFNLYQSLHTTVVGPAGKPVEVQIRTQEMHRRAEYGVAAHWGYKERRAAPTTCSGSSASSTGSRRPSDPGEFMETLKIDLEQDEVFVFTPKGKVITLPVGRHAGRLRLRHPHRGRPPLHRRAGQRPAGAARLRRSRRATRSRSSPPRSRAPGPSRDWLQFVAHAEGANKIRQWFSRERRGRRHRDRARGAGQGAAHGGPAGPEAPASSTSLDEVADGDATTPTSRRCTPPSARTTCRPRRSCSALAEGAAQRRGAAAGHHRPAAAQRARRSRAPRHRRARRGPRRRDGPAVAVLHAGARRRDHGLRHPRPRRVGAPHRLRQRRRRWSSQAERLIEVEWDHDQPATFVVSVEVEALDRSRLLRDVGPGAVRAPREHPLVHLADVDRPGREVAVRLRARRPRPPRVDPLGDQARSTASTTPTACSRATPGGEVA